MAVKKEAFYTFLEEGADCCDAALAYASYGLFVLPLEENGKAPATHLVAHGLHDATTKTHVIKDWWSKGNWNVGIALYLSCLVAIDVDPRHGGDKALKQLIEQIGPLPATYTVKTPGGGNHYYYRVGPDFFEDNNFPSKLGDGLEFKAKNYLGAPPSVINGNHYRVEVQGDFARAPLKWLADAAYFTREQSESRAWDFTNEEWYFRVGERNEGLTAYAGWLRAKAHNAEEIATIIRAIGPNRVEDFESIDGEVDTIARSVCRYAPSGVQFADMRVILRKRTAKPELDRACLIGPIGDWVRHVEPDSEAHPAAMLAQALAAFGALIGAKHDGDIAPGFEVHDAYHRTTTYVCLVGDSATGGKGDSYNRVKRLMEAVDPTWDPDEGVQTGEGLIDILADQQPTGEVAHIQGKEVEHTRGGQLDRRFWIVEPEFGRLLNVGKRKGSSLTYIYRPLWEGSTKKKTRGDKQTVSNVTICLITHITKAELERDYDPVDMLNGFGNRFMYIHTERVRSIPIARSLSKSELKRFAAPLKEALKFAQEEAPGEYEFTKQAFELWSTLVQKHWHKEDPNPVLAALQARVRPIVWRTAVIYAVSECSDMVESRHLRAAVALWDYCVQSIEYIFNDYIGDRDAAKLLVKLRSHPEGLPMSELYKVFSNNISKGRIQAALRTLIERQLVNVRHERGKGKYTKEVYFAKFHDQ